CSRQVDSTLTTMCCHRLAIPVVLGALAPLANALDLTPIENWREQEGVRITTLVFSDPSGKVRYQPPGDWSYSGDATTLWVFPSQQEAFMRFQLFPRKARVEGAAAEDLARWSKTFVSADASDVALLEERPSPFTLSGRSSREFIYTYKAGGQRFQTAV